MSDLGGDGRAALAGLRAAWGRDWDAAGAYLAALLAAMGWEVDQPAATFGRGAVGPPPTTAGDAEGNRS